MLRTAQFGLGLVLAAVASAAGAGPLEERNKQVAAGYLKVLSSGDISKIETFWADDLKWTIPQDPSISPLGGTYDRAGLRKLLAGFGRVMPNGATFTPIAMTAEGDRVAVEVVGDAQTPIGPFHNQYHFLFVIRDGKIVQGKEYADSLFMRTWGAKAGR